MLAHSTREERHPAVFGGGLFAFLGERAVQLGPVLYPDEYFKATAEGEAQRDIDECNRLAGNYLKFLGKYQK